MEAPKDAASPRVLDSPKPSCRSCRYYVARTSKVGILFTNGKGWEYKTEMDCEKRSPYVRELLACPFYQREPGSDDE